jgi:hypothetical protein
MERGTAHRRELLWFIGIYLGSVAVFAAATYLLRKAYLETTPKKCEDLPSNGVGWNRKCK